MIRHKEKDRLVVIKEFRCLAYAGMGGLFAMFIAYALNDVYSLWFGLAGVFIVIGIVNIPNYLVLKYAPLDDFREYSFTPPTVKSLSLSLSSIFALATHG